MYQPRRDRGRPSFLPGDAAVWAATGERKRAAALLRERLHALSLSRLMSALLGSLLAVLQNKPEEAARLMEAADPVREPEILVYFARHYAFLGQASPAVRCLRRAMEAGFVCAPETLLNDAWFSPVRKARGFAAFLAESQAVVRAAESTFEANLPDPFAWRSD